MRDDDAGLRRFGVHIQRDAPVRGLRDAHEVVRELLQLIVGTEHEIIPLGQLTEHLEDFVLVNHVVLRRVPRDDALDDLEHLLVVAGVERRVADEALVFRHVIDPADDIPRVKAVEELAGLLQLRAGLIEQLRPLVLIRLNHADVVRVWLGAKVRAHLRQEQHTRCDVQVGFHILLNELHRAFIVLVEPGIERSTGEVPTEKAGVNRHVVPVQSGVGHAFQHTLNGEVARASHVNVCAFPIADAVAHDLLNAVWQRAVKHSPSSFCMQKKNRQL